MIIIKTYIESLPASLEESAEIDGAGFLTVFNRIIFPISKPILATVAVYAAVGQWNSWQDNFFLIDKQSLTTLSYNLYLVLNQAQVLANQMMSKTPGSTSPVSSPISSVTVQMAMVVVTVLPIMLVYPFLQRFFTKGIMLGAVKG
jgi:ABC-type glycerol-3-phosphate transport system permease component